jgi:hypothetical protein
MIRVPFFPVCIIHLEDGEAGERAAAGRRSRAGRCALEPLIFRYRSSRSGAPERGPAEEDPSNRGVSARSSTTRIRVAL